MNVLDGGCVAIYWVSDVRRRMLGYLQWWLVYCDIHKSIFRTSIKYAPLTIPQLIVES